MNKIKESDIHESFNIWIEDLKNLVKIVYHIDADFELGPVERYVRKPDHALKGINKKDPYVIHIDYTLTIDIHDILKMGTYRAIGREDLGNILAHEKILEVNKRSKGLIVSLFSPQERLRKLAKLIDVDIISLQEGLKINNLSNVGGTLVIAGLMYMILNTNEKCEMIVNIFKDKFRMFKNPEDKSIMGMVPILIEHYIVSRNITDIKYIERLKEIKNNIMSVINMSSVELEYLINQIMDMYSKDQDKKIIIQGILRGLTPEQKQIILAALKGLTPEQEKIFLAALKGLTPEQLQMMLAMLQQPPEQSKMFITLFNLINKNPEKFKEILKMFNA